MERALSSEKPIRVIAYEATGEIKPHMSGKPQNQNLGACSAASEDLVSANKFRPKIFSTLRAQVKSLSGHDLRGMKRQPALISLGVQIVDHHCYPTPVTG